jgi:protein-S-isoprenylcysteine O-methyltransferase Ste14
MLKKEISWINVIPIIFSMILLMSQFISGIYILSTINQIKLFAYIGVGLYVCSGLIFGMLPIIEFHKKGGIVKGKSYIHTTKLVDTGIYAIVRHPQYITWMLWAIAGIFLFQHWTVIILGFLIIPFVYIDLLNADKDGIKKFGDDYRQYMKKVPRANFILGILLYLRHKK